VHLVGFNYKKGRRKVVFVSQMAKNTSDYALVSKEAVPNL